MTARRDGRNAPNVFRAERRMGEILRDMAERGERRDRGNPQLSRDATIGLSDLGIPRDRASQHERELEVGLTYLTIQDLAARWQVSRATVRAIPRDELPYIEFGQGALLKRRRYDPRAVAEYERVRQRYRLAPLWHPRAK
jgi:hypothetical protein